MTLTQIATRLRVLSQTLDRPITNLTMALKVAAPNQPTMHHQYRRNEREFNADSNYYYFITNKTEYTFKHWIQKCLGSFENKPIMRINIYMDLLLMLSFEFCSSGSVFFCTLSLKHHICECRPIPCENLFTKSYRINLVSTISPNITDKTSSLTYDVRQVSFKEPLVNHFFHRTHCQIWITATMKKYNCIDVIETELYERTERDIGKPYTDMLSLISEDVQRTF